MRLIFLLLSSFALVIGEPDVSHYNNLYPPPSQRRADGACNECRDRIRCTSELDVRDTEVPKEVPVPEIEYQRVYSDKEVRVPDFEILDNRVPKLVRLEDERVILQPSVRNVEKVVTIRVPRIKENVVVKRVDRVKVVTEYRKRAKPIRVVHTRQVAVPIQVNERKDVIRRVLVPETETVPMPLRLANKVEVEYERVDKPVTLPSLDVKFCENVMDIFVKTTCPQPKRVTEAYLPPVTTPRPRVRGYSYNAPS